MVSKIGAWAAVGVGTACLIIGGNLWAGRYTVTPIGSSGPVVIVVDNWQHTMSLCQFDREAGTSCRLSGPVAP